MKLDQYSAELGRHCEGAADFKKTRDYYWVAAGTVEARFNYEELAKISKEENQFKRPAF